MKNLTKNEWVWIFLIENQLSGIICGIEKMNSNLITGECNGWNTENLQFY